MLSILIPTYNQDIRKLVFELNRQAAGTYSDYEIIVMEDGSTQFLKENSAVNELENCRYYVLEENIGRSAIRNRLADESKYDQLLFIDCDAEVFRNNYVEKYLAFVRENSVVIGGTAYDPAYKDPAYSLRLKYGQKREAKSAIERTKKGRYAHFSTFNFMICKSTFMQIRFDETIRGYGHEDTLLGYHIAEHDCAIHHIDNPLYHTGLDDNRLFLKKTEESVRNLLYLYQTDNYPFLSKQSQLLRTYERLKRRKICRFTGFLFTPLKPFLQLNLTGRWPSLKLYDLYKLLFLCHSSIYG